MRPAKIIFVVLLIVSLFLVQGTTVSEAPITVTRQTLPVATTLIMTVPTTIQTVKPNLTRQYSSSPDLPEWTQQRYQAVTVSEPSEIEAVLCAAQREWDCEDAKKIAFCESSMRPGIISKPNTNGTRDHGLFQINDGAWKQAFYNRWGRILELEMNVELAYHIWELYGWSPWTCKKVLGPS